MQQLISAHGVVLLAEEPDGRAVGFAEVSVRRDHVEGTSSAPVPYLEGWYVVPGCRRRGIGRALIERVAEWALGAGFSELASDAEIGNIESLRAHEDLGFREVGRSVHFVLPLKTREAKHTLD